jgi:hypothetical protein
MERERESVCVCVCVCGPLSANTIHSLSLIISLPFVSQTAMASDKPKPFLNEKDLVLGKWNSKALQRN